MQINILEGRAGYIVLMGRVSVTISYSFRCLTIETEKYNNENSFIENLAASKYSMWHREANKCNNKIYILPVQKSCPVMQKCKQACVSKLLSAKKEKKWEPISFLCSFKMYIFFFFISTRHEHV